MAVSKVKKVEHSFREQLEAREKAHREDLSRVTKEKQLEINAATRKARRRFPHHHIASNCSTVGVQILPVLVWQSQQCE